MDKSQFAPSDDYAQFIINWRSIDKLFDQSMNRNVHFRVETYVSGSSNWSIAHNPDYSIMQNLMKVDDRIQIIKIPHRKHFRYLIILDHQDDPWASEVVAYYTNDDQFVNRVNQVKHGKV